MIGPNPAAVLPYVAIGAILALRWRNNSRPRPLRPAMLVAVPVIILLGAGAILLQLPAVRWGWPALAGGLVLGGLAGWQRTRLMHLERDGETGRIMLRNSPAAFLFLLAVLAARKLFAWETQMGSPGDGHRSAPAALVAVYATIGFVVAITAASRAELWRRAAGLD